VGELCTLGARKWRQEGVVAGVDVLEVLRRSGWSEERSVDITASLQALVEHGVVVWPELEALLRQFSGLTLSYQRPVRPDVAWFDSARACRGVDPGWTVDFGLSLGARFAPIGCSDHEHLTLYATDDGRFYGSFYPCLAYLGSSVMEMLDGIINDHFTPVDWRGPAADSDGVV
jgi:hypothetical protein